MTVISASMEKPAYRIRVISPYTTTVVFIFIGYLLLNFLVISARVKTHYVYNYEVFPSCTCDFTGSLLDDGGGKVWSGDTACFDLCLANPFCKSAVQKYKELGDGKSTCELFSQRCPVTRCLDPLINSDSEAIYYYYMERSSVDSIDYL